MEPEKIYNIDEIATMHFPKRHSEDYWYRNTDPYIRNYITGRDCLSLSGIGRFGLNRARNEYMSLGNTFRRRSLSAPEMAKYENKYHIDQSLFDVARDEIERDYTTDAEKYQTGRMSDRRWNRRSQRYEQQMENLNENQYILDQQQNPLKYVRPHKDGDIWPALAAIGLPFGIIGGVHAAPYLWQFLNNPFVQAIGTIDGLRNLVTENGIQKTYNHFKNGEYGKGTLSLAGDVLDASPLLAIGKGLKYGKLVGNKLGFNTGVREFMDHLPGGKLLTESTSSSDPFYNGGDLRKRISSTLYNSYNRERYIDTKLSTGPALVLTDPKYGDVLIHGDPAVTGLTNIKRGGISSNMSSFPSFQNGNLVPAKGEIKFRNGSSLNYHPIFFSANTPFFETARGDFNFDYKDLKEMLSNPRLKGVKQNIELHWLNGDTTYPYRFIETKYTPDLDVKGHFLIGGQGETHVMSVPMDEIIGHEYNPLFKTWELHRYVDPNIPRNMEDSNIINYIHF